MRLTDNSGEDEATGGDGTAVDTLASRRAILRGSCAGAASLCLLPAVAGLHTGQGTAASVAASGTVSFEDQTADSRDVVVALIETDIHVSYYLAAADGDTIFARGSLDPGRYEEYRIELQQPVTERREVELGLYALSIDQVVAIDTAVLSPVAGATFVDGLSVQLVERDPDAGFEYPYFLYAPTIRPEQRKPLLVHPNNSGESTDDFARHREAAREEATSGFPRRTADRLPAPLLVPVFPRPRDRPVDNTVYVQQLDRQTLTIDGGPLERVDRQLLAMAEDARARLQDAGYPIEDGLMLNGFSASGNFVERFAALHPAEVVSVTAGGVNGMPILPIERADGHDLDYHVGIAEIEALTGEPFDRDAFAEVHRFLYMGEHDVSDTIPYSDTFTLDRLRTAALDVYGRNMQRDRFPYAKAVYDQLGVNAVFREYAGAGHVTDPAAEDVATFHRRAVDGEPIEALRGDLGGGVPNLGAHVERSPAGPTVGETITFDGSRSTVEGTITEYVWHIDGERTTGVEVAHTFDQPGGHVVELAVAVEGGDTVRTVEQVVVTDPELTVSEPSVSVLNDETTANTIDLRIEAPEPVGYQVFVDERGGPDASGTVTPGVNELTVHLDMMLTRRQAIQVAIYPDGGGSALAEDRVTVEPGGGTSMSSAGWDHG